MLIGDSKIKIAASGFIEPIAAICFSSKLYRNVLLSMLLDEVFKSVILPEASIE
jgi:hypothetical protein